MLYIKCDTFFSFNYIFNSKFYEFDHFDASSLFLVILILIFFYCTFDLFKAISLSIFKIQDLYMGIKSAKIPLF